MANKSAQNVVDAIGKSRKTTLDRVINGLGIRHVGEHTARQLALRFKTLEALSASIGPVPRVSLRETDPGS